MNFLDATSFLYFFYFSFRILIDNYAPRVLTTAFIYVIMILVLIFSRLWKKRGIENFVSFYMMYLIMRLSLVTGLREIHISSFVAYIAPIMLLLLARSKSIKLIIKIFISLSVISLGLGVINALFGIGNSIFQSLNWDKTIIEGLIVQRGVSLIGTSVGTGIIAAVCIIYSISILKGIYLFTSIGISILSLLLSLSRGGLVILIVGISVYGIGILLNLKILSLKTYASVILSALVLIFTAIIIPTYFSYNPLFIRFTQDILNFQEQGNSVRLDSWALAINTWQTSPFIGIGFGLLGSNAVQDGYRDLAAESMYLKIFGELGIIGFLLYFLPIILFLAVGIRKLNSDPVLFKLRLASLSCVSGFLIGGLFFQNLEYDYFSGIFWLSIGIFAMSQSNYQINNQKQRVFQ